MKSAQFLEEIREAEGLKRAVLRKIEVQKGTVTFHLVTDLTYTQEDVARAREVAAKYVPAGYRAEVKIVKSLPSAEGVKKSILDLLASRFPAIAAFVAPEEVGVETDGAGGRFYVEVTESARAMLTAEKAADAIAAALCRSYCGTWTGEIRYTRKEMGEIERAPLPPPEKVVGPRTFEICNYRPIDGGAPTRAIYIADLQKEMENVTVCGALSYLEERTTKSGKPYFSLTLSDGTGMLRCAYFTKKATLERVRAVRAGESVCLTGDNELYQGDLSFRVKKLDYGTPPEGFVPEAKPSRPVPAQYRAVFPAPASDFVQEDIFGTARLPEALVKGRFVVFDLETTGLNEGGTMDRIIEIGAVKIEEGRICQKFSTFVACPVRLPDKIVELTGITDEMLRGAPEVGAVIADFYKFCDGCALVGHNVQFDAKFIRYYGEKEGYLFGQRTYDTLTFSQQELRLANYKLNTVAEHFGFTFRHHRAYDDAFVTAKIFIELARKRGGLPL